MTGRGRRTRSARKRNQSTVKISRMFYLYKLLSVVVVTLAFIIYIANLPESNSYFTAQGQSEPLTVVFGSGLTPLSQPLGNFVENAEEEFVEIEIPENTEELDNGSVTEDSEIEEGEEINDELDHIDNTGEEEIEEEHDDSGEGTESIKDPDE